jgi:hypothetical protein
MKHSPATRPKKQTAFDRRGSANRLLQNSNILMHIFVITCQRKCLFPDIAGAMLASMA